MNLSTEQGPSSQLATDSSIDNVCLANATLVLPHQEVHGSITIEQGVISDIRSGAQVPSGAIDCGRDYVLPGLIELHTDNLERHIEPRPGVDWPHLPALISHDAELASTGITTVFDALRVGSISNTSAGLGAYARTLADELLAARSSNAFKISHFIHLRAEICSETLLEELDQFGIEDRVGIVSLMDHTPGQRQFRDLTALRVYMSKKRNMNDAEFEEHIAFLKTLQARIGRQHETGAIAHASRLRAVLASHDDTTQDQVETSLSNGVTFAEFPTTLEAAQSCRKNGIAVMMGAPNLVRGGSHSGNVSAAALADADLLDIISSDYVPSALLLSVFQLAKQWNNLPRAVLCATRNPANAVGLKNRGALKQGYRGDVLRVSASGTTPMLRGVWSHGSRVA
jgi:alpha-D-ribose 1-methylphosphonate 5-triphosphate diphosphatase